MASTIADVPRIPDLLNALHHLRGYSNERLARLARVQAPEMTHFRKEERAIKAENLQELSVALCVEGITDIAAAFLTPEYVIYRRSDGPADGCILAEIADAAEQLGEVIGRDREGDVDAALAAVGRLMKAADDLCRDLQARRMT